MPGHSAVRPMQVGSCGVRRADLMGVNNNRPTLRSHAANPNIAVVLDASDMLQEISLWFHNPNMPKVSDISNIHGSRYFK